MEKNAVQILEEAHHLVNISLKIREKLLKSPTFDKEPLSKGIEDYKIVNERLEQLISEEHAKVQE